jgi:hypothetical protein
MFHLIIITFIPFFYKNYLLFLDEVHKLSFICLP